MKHVIWIAALFFTLSVSAQTEVAAKGSTMKKELEKKTTALKKKHAKKSGAQALAEPLIVEKDTLINGETVTMLQNEQEYTGRSRFEKMLAKRLEIDAAEFRRKEINH